MERASARERERGGGGRTKINYLLLQLSALILFSFIKKRSHIAFYDLVFIIIVFRFQLRESRLFLTFIRFNFLKIIRLL